MPCCHEDDCHLEERRTWQTNVLRVLLAICTPRSLLRAGGVGGEYGGRRV